MSKSSAARRLRQGLPSVPGTGRRAQFSDRTKRALVEVAERLFTEDGYAGTSLDAIVAGAEVTKGALYHHFDGKRALFEAVFERVEAQAVGRIKRAMQEQEDPWDQAVAGLRGFVDVVQQPAYRRVVVLEGPAVLGHERVREQVRTSFTVVHDLVANVLGDRRQPIDPMLLEGFSTIFFGALSSAGEFVADSHDPGAASRRVEVAIGYILGGLQLMRDAGVALPGEQELAAGAGPDGDAPDA
ncbi:TetR/AcrR family transcriptional regulator [Nocardioides zeae]|uniref:TetR/AcrR family transcriptional regulator n=1 Tax=Nocardioides imazamoxiresistens TaxID=3231893 RepID=A0ABU3PQQ8_9ACTN|nr:TetR/AcrR family transcriptional regulator [Nocardioides zeae]MDT9591538.1 TetR/AcrR family transcriptional regulator [Nocardioides zeae]